MQTQASQIAVARGPVAVERKLQISLTVMVALGCALFGVAQGTVGLPGAAVAAAVFSLYVTDLRKAFRLNRLLANLVALAASIVVLLDFFTSSNRSQLVAIANLLICLQVVLLFQEKTPRTYGYLAVLSLLQVVVAASLPVHLEFGILLVVYIAAAINFLALLFICRTFWPAPPPRAAVSAETLMIALAGLHLLATFAMRNTLDLAPGELLQIAWLLLAMFYAVQFVRLAWQPGEGRRRRLAALLCVGFLQAVLTGVLLVDVSLGGPLYLLLLAALLVIRFRYPRMLGAPAAAANAQAEAGAGLSAVSARPLGELFRTPPKAAFLYDGERMARQLTTRRLALQLGGLWLASLVFAAFLFMSVPRPRAADRVFSEDDAIVAMPEGEVKLNEMVDILDTHEPVFQVEFVNERTGKPYKINSELYLRGPVFQVYRADEAVWKSFPDQNGPRRNSTLRPVNDSRLEVVRQKFTFEPVKNLTLISVFPAYLAKEREPQDRNPRGRGIRFDLASKRLTRPSREQPAATAYRYEICTTGFYKSQLLTIVPHELGSMVPFDDEFVGEQLAIDLEQLKQAKTVRKNFPHVTRLADQVVSNLPHGAGRVVIARALQQHFLFSPQYHYTLEFSKVQRTPGMNPIEDFVANHHSGHCEYFASALVIALRSQDIPARMVVGYRGGEYNGLGGFYQFTTSDAHAWVEAYLPPDEVTPEVAEAMLNSGQKPVAGAWLRLDPTPAGDDTFGLSDRSGVLAKASELYGYARLIWGDYVVNLNARRQDTMFEPGRTAESLFGSANLDQWSFLSRRPTAAQQALIWLLVIGLFAAIGTGYVLWRLWRRLRRGRRPRNRRKSPAQQAKAAPRLVPFYQRMITLLQQHGLTRMPGQTPREFAGLVGGEFNESLALRDLAPVPRSVVEAFYRVRFGNEQLPSRELDEIEQALNRLDAALVESKQAHAADPRSPSTDHRQRGNGHPRNSTS